MESQPRAAASAILRSKGRYLLVLRRNPPAEDMYAFPGGRIEPGETPEAAALRECHEETGIMGRNPRLHSVYDLPGDPFHYLLSAFLVDCDCEAEPIAADDAATAAWYAPHEIEALPVPESVRFCINDLEKLHKSS